MSRNPEHDALRQMDLAGLYQDTWRRLVRGAADRRSPLHTPVLSTLDARGRPSARTLVLRAATPAQHALVCHSDARASKIAGLSRSPWAAWVFWDPRSRIQIRARGPVTVHHNDAVARDHWQRLGLLTRRGYTAAPAPGTATDAPVTGLTAALQAGVGGPGAVEHGADNFAVLACTVVELEWLLLDRAGHRRAQFEGGPGDWQGRWLVP